MLIYDDRAFGTQECKLDIWELFPTIDERRDFHNRFENFLKSDPYNRKVFSLNGELLAYSSEVFVSDRIDNRPPLLLLLGNPASHSVAEGVCFAYEKGGHEHRFWRLLDETGVITFLDLPPISSEVKKKIETRRNSLLELNYRSPFRIGIAVFYSLPSPASDKEWQGVTGIKKLLGANAFQKISRQEEARISLIISRFIGTSGGIITFQKDAYESVRSQDTPTYDQQLARQGKLVGNYRNGQHILLAGAPPTREAYWVSSKKTMRKYKNLLTEHCIPKD
jgi:CRISPR/Cas system-associated protein endoribonuclease Cas2